MSETTLSKSLPAPANIYGKVLTGTIREKLMEVQQIEEDLNLKDELHMLRAKLMEELGKPAEEQSPKAQLIYLKEVRETVKVMAGMIENLKGYIPVKMMPIILRQVVEVLRHNIKDEALLAKISVQLGRIRIPATQHEASGFDRAVAEGKVPGE